MSGEAYMCGCTNSRGIGSLNFHFCTRKHFEEWVDRHAERYAANVTAERDAALSKLAASEQARAKLREAIEESSCELASQYDASDALARIEANDNALRADDEVGGEV